MKETSKRKSLALLTSKWSASCEGPVVDLEFTDHYDDLVVLPGEGRPIILDGITGVTRCHLPAHMGGNLCLSINRSGIIATGGADGRVLVSAADGTPLTEFLFPGVWIDLLTWNLAGNRLAVGIGRRVCLIEVLTGKMHYSLELPGTITSLDWRPGSDSLAVAAYGGVWILGGESLEVEWELPRPGSVVALRWDAVGRRLAAGCQESSVHVWDMQSIVKEPDGWGVGGFERAVKQLAWNDQTLTASGGRATVVCDLDESGLIGEAARPLLGHADPVTCLTNIPPRGWATGDAQGNFLLWDDQRPYATCSLPTRLNACVWHGPDLVVIGGIDGSIHMVVMPS